MKIVALDIGGTSIKSGIWNGTGVEEVREHDTNAARGGAYVMERAKEILHTYGGFEAIGISTAGQVNSEEGYIRYANENIPGYTGTRIRDILTGEFGVPVAVENDVNAAAIGESQFGALDRADILAYRKQDYEWDVLVADKAAAQRKYPGAVIDPASIDDIMLLYIKGVQG